MGLRAKLMSRMGRWQRRPEEVPAAPIAPAAPGARAWPQGEEGLPWFDRADARSTLAARVRAGRCDAGQAALLEEWIEQGCFTIPALINPERLAALRRCIEELWHREQPYDGLNLADVLIDGRHHLSLPHAELLSLPAELRERARLASNWRASALHLHADAARRVFDDDRARELCSLVFDHPAEPRYSLVFQKGSEQKLHQDTAAFHVFPRNHLIGVWIALEDIQPDSGPLLYCPGSHRQPLYEGFDNYPQTNRRTASPEQLELYDRHVAELAQRYETRAFLPRAGDALFWHGQLIHGGSPIINPASTRVSFVIHFIAEGADRGDQVVGPFNW